MVSFPARTDCSFRDFTLEGVVDDRNQMQEVINWRTERVIGTLRNNCGYRNSDEQGQWTVPVFDHRGQKRRR